LTLGEKIRGGLQHRSGQPHRLIGLCQQGLQEAHEGVCARVSTPTDIAKRAVGRPLQSTHKQPMTLRMDPQALEGWRASGKGWQTGAAELLAKHAPG